MRFETAVGQSNFSQIPFNSRHGSGLLSGVSLSQVPGELRGLKLGFKSLIFLCQDWGDDPCLCLRPIFFVDRFCFYDGHTFWLSSRWR